MAIIKMYRFGLAPKFTAVVVAAVLSTGILVSAAMFYESHHRLREQIITNNEANVTLAAAFVRNYVRRIQESVEFLAKSSIVTYSVSSGDYSEAEPFLREFLRVHTEIDNASLHDVRGIVRASGISLAASNQSRGDHDWFKQIIESGKPLLGNPGISAATRRPVVPYAVPILSHKGTVRGVILGSISLSTLKQTITPLRPGSHALSSLLDRRNGGIILAHSDTKQVLQPVSGKVEAITQLLRGERGAVETKNNASEVTLISFAPVPYLPWSIMISQPSSEVFAPVTDAARDSTILMAAMLLVTVLSAASLVRHVTQPLAELREAASSFSAGDLSRRVKLIRKDELGELGHAFNQMAAALAKRSAEVESANRELQEQNRVVQQANRLKSEFLANMSHELRTPLNAIIGFAQLMHDGKVGVVSSAHEEYLGHILDSARHLLQLINDVLDLAKVESGKMEFNPEPVNLTKLITEIRQILQTLSASKRLQVDLEVSPAVEQLVIDPAKLKQVLYNYLSNAIKFTQEEGRIAVRAQPEGASYFRLEVEDTGIGIGAEDFGKLFVEFQQLEGAMTKRHQGTGLGLALTKKIVEAQGGRVGAQSILGRGSTFYAILPRSSRQMEGSTVLDPMRGMHAQDGSNVLVIEDNEADRHWLAKVLGEAGYIVDSAATGAEGVAKARANRFKAIILDLILPEMGGWEVLHAIRAGGPNQHTVVIVATVVAEKEVAKGFSVQDFLVKPIAPESLLEALKNARVDASGIKKKILVVDDDPNTLKMAKAALQAGGYEAVCHASAESGLQAAAEAKFNAVVLDLVMTEIDGFEFLTRFRELSTCKETPVVVWTSKDITAYDLKRLRNSAQSIAVKSGFSIEAVLQELQRYVGPAGESQQSSPPETREL
jgi:signal transduction histidine kinase/DNA-binding response OmpR family regulator